MAGLGHGGRHELHALRSVRPRLPSPDAGGAAAPEPDPPFGSWLAFHILTEWAWGKISAQEVQRLAHSAVKDQVLLLRSLGANPDHTNPMLSRLAKLGNEGRNPGNCLTQMLNLLGEPNFPAPMLPRVPLLNHKGSAGESVVVCDFPIFLPHALFAYFFTHDRTRFDRLYLGACSTVAQRRAFWQEAVRRGDPRLRAHPLRRTPGWEDVTIPLALHGDGVPVLRVGKAGNASYDAYSTQSLWVQGSTLNCKVLVFGVFGDAVADDTYQEIWRVLCWSIHWLGQGVWPPVDMFGERWPAGSADRARGGKALAGGFRACLYALKGDLDYYAKTLKLRHYNANAMCDLCPAHRDVHDPANLYNNFVVGAAWKRSLYTEDEWRALYRGRFLHYVFTLQGVSQHCLEPDELHVLHLGCSQYTCGSVLYLLCMECLPNDAEANLEAVWAVIKEYYSFAQARDQYTNFYLKTFLNMASMHTTFPCLKGKAAECRDLVPALAEAWNQLAKAHTDFRAVSFLLRNLTEVQDILKAHSDCLFLPEGQVERLQSCIDDYLLGYQRLAASAEANGQMLWNNPTKFHWLFHWSRKALYLNPRLTNTFIDEDFVGRIKHVVHSAAPGSSMPLMHTKTADKYRWGMHLLFMKD